MSFDFNISQATWHGVSQLMESAMELVQHDYIQNVFENGYNFRRPFRTKAKNMVLQDKEGIGDQGKRLL